MKISAVIFDLDGTIIDSEEQWSKSFVIVLKLLGKNVIEKAPQTQGLSNKSNWIKLLAKFDIKTSKTLDELEHITLMEYSRLVHEINLRDGAIEFIEGLKDSEIKVALATSTEWWIVEKIFDHIKIENLFDSVTTGDEVLNKKPAPDSFLLAADKLGVREDECLVIEDSPSGVEAAKAAEMKVIAIDETAEKEGLDEANLIVGSFEEITPKVLLEI